MKNLPILFSFSVFRLRLQTTVATSGPKSRLDPLTLTSANAVGLLTVSGSTHTATWGPVTSNTKQRVKKKQKQNQERLKFVPTTISANSAAHSLTTLGVLVSLANFFAMRGAETLPEILRKAKPNFVFEAEGARWLKI